MTDFFISYTSTDTQWAEWIAYELEHQGYSVIIQSWDFMPGSNFIEQMNKAIINANKTIAVISKEYLKHLFTMSEWAAAFAKDPIGSQRKLIPIKIEPCEIDGLLSQVIFIDFINKNENEAHEELLRGVSSHRKKPRTAPGFPGNPEKNEKKSVFPARRFVYAQISAQELLNLEKISNPFSHFIDATSAQESMNIFQVYCYLWLPRSEYLASSKIQLLSPLSAICTINPMQLFEHINEHIDLQTLRKLNDFTPSNLFPEHKEKCLRAMAMVLPSCFVASVVIPELVLKVRQRKIEFAYQTIFNLFADPLLEMHRRIGVDKFNLFLPEMGAYKKFVLKIAKNTVKSAFPVKGKMNMVFAEKDTREETFLNLARLLAWTVGNYYNENNTHWLSFLDPQVFN